jgi:hypothetical protein
MADKERDSTEARNGFSDQEIDRRRDEAVRRALNTPPQRKTQKGAGKLEK